VRLKAAVKITDTSDIPTMKTEFDKMRSWQGMSSCGMAHREEFIQFAMSDGYKEGMFATPYEG
jgi:hypothetical protein